ncbi:MAG: hypothetical protein J4432_02435 [DPANN group archaeon]|nr:hypothetical protein [DPANN group archaeon]
MWLAYLQVMALRDSQIPQIVEFVKQEPCTIQDISKRIKKSWVTTDSYVKEIADRTGLIAVKTFRQGTRGALKLVYYVNVEAVLSDTLKDDLYNQIKTKRRKSDFDFMDIYQFVQKNGKRSFVDQQEENSAHVRKQLVPLFRKTKHNLYCFSGNLSFLNVKAGKTRVLDVFEELLKRKVRIHILCRVNIASLNNISKLNSLMKRYPDLIEIKHAYQPLRGFVADDDIARFTDEEQLKDYKPDELNRNTRIIYEITDMEWVSWLQKVFWNLYRGSMDYTQRLKELEGIM